jgi:hypothetical protein
MFAENKIVFVVLIFKIVFYSEDSVEYSRGEVSAGEEESKIGYC